ncbi:uncharacterized protein LOC115603550 [Strigops habroptila]|uniref:uncharacterized protein LOC115603550 n=1 Tax=Strigops habroptila TaxID=2489341 RepID=UPI0011CFF671|nr:uncharacterized protein LOC115603550 [Strigops habroptila]
MAPCLECRHLLPVNTPSCIGCESPIAPQLQPQTNVCVKTPGPAAFPKVELDIFKKKGSHVHNGTRSSLGGDKTAKPGPAEYCPGKSAVEKVVAGSVPVPQIIPLGIPLPRKAKHELHTNPLLEMKSGLNKSFESSMDFVQSCAVLWKAVSQQNTELERKSSKSDHIIWKYGSQRWESEEREQCRWHRCRAHHVQKSPSSSFLSWLFICGTRGRMFVLCMPGRRTVSSRNRRGCMQLDL